MKQGKILIVDDESAVRDVLCDILKHEGYEVTVVENGEAALKEARKKSFDLVLADIMMPKMDGLELIQQFRELSPETAHVLITGYPSIETAKAAMQEGVYDYILKPFDRVKLCSAVANALQRKRLADKKAKPKTISEETLAEVKQTLRNSELFETLSDQEIENIANICQEQTYDAEETVYRQGERSETLYVIQDGCVALVRSVKARDVEQFVTIDLLGKGKFFGWSGVIEPHVHTESAVCQMSTKVLAISGAELRFIIRREPHAGLEIIERLAMVLGNRLRASYRALESNL